MNNKEFQRNKACTFYGEWEQDAEMIKEDYGLEGMALYYDAIVKYALHEIEIDAVKKPPIKYFWSTIREKIDASQEHRSRGFSKIDTDAANKIIAYKTEHQEASQREIADAVGCSLGKVNKTLKSNEPTNSTNTSTATNTTTSTTMNMNANNDEVRIFVIESFKKKHKWNQIQDDIQKKFGFYIAFDSIGGIIEEYKSDSGILDRIKDKIKQEQEKKLTEEKSRQEQNKAVQEINIVIDACNQKFMFTPTTEEIMESYISDNKVASYGLRNYYSFNMDRMKKFITDECYGSPKSWQELHRCWVEYCNTMYGLSY